MILKEFYQISTTERSNDSSVRVTYRVVSHSHRFVDCLILCMYHALSLFAVHNWCIASQLTFSASIEFCHRKIFGIDLNEKVAGIGYVG